MAFSDLCYIDAAGYHAPDFPTIQDYIITGVQGIYGTDIYLEPDSQDGQFINLFAQALSDAAQIGQAVYSSFSPLTAQGVALSSLIKINGLTRQVATYSSVPLTIIGTTGTVITNGIAVDTNNQQWALPASVTIPLSGTITVQATATTLGAIDAQAGTVNKIFTPTLGWQSVNNATAAVPGAPVETDAQVRGRQATSTADPSKTVLDGIVSGVANLTGVTDARGYENDTDTTDGNGLPEHSICIVTSGSATDQAICDEIMVHKSPGVNTYGSSSATSYDDHGMPVVIHYQPAIAATINVTVTLSTKQGYAPGFASLIKQSVASQINSFGIGNKVILSQLYYPAYLNGGSQSSTYTVASITLGKNGGSQTASDIPINFDEIAVCDPLVNVTVIAT